MKTAGFLLIFFGIAIGMFAFRIDTSVYAGVYGLDRVNNLGLMSEKQNILFVAGVLCIMGSIFMAAGFLKQSQQIVLNAQSQIKDQSPI